jgi:hypothetical protein
LPVAGYQLPVTSYQLPASRRCDGGRLFVVNIGNGPATPNKITKRLRRVVLFVILVPEREPSAVAAVGNW